MDDIKKLENDGIIFNWHLFKGTISLVSGDNLASNYLGGFKSPLGSFRNCQQCMSTDDTMKTQGMVPDVIHDVLEGVAPYEVKEMLKVFVGSGTFRLDDLNAFIANFPYPDVHSNCKPSCISQTTYHSNDNKIAIQMWVLMRYLPIIIGDKVPVNDPYWDNFLTLLRIMDYILAPIISQDEIAY
uniref:Uncharacterized protein n=1 Tax=Amphimedon queenslandica TaxID=400682 RepID=A0A1X7V448_AMPQE